MRVLIDGHDTDGRLVLADNQLAAVFVRLDGTHQDLLARMINANELKASRRFN